MENAVNIGSTDYWNGYIVLHRNKVTFLRVTAMDYCDMEEAIRDSWRPAEDWREEVSEWYTDVGLEEYLEDYEYDYEWYWYEYVGELDLYYNPDDDDNYYDYWVAANYERGTFIDRLMEVFDEELWNDNSFEWASWMDYQSLMNKLWEFYDRAIEADKEIAMKNKPHWNVFNYYK